MRTNTSLANPAKSLGSRNSMRTVRDDRSRAAKTSSNCDRHCICGSNWTRRRREDYHLSRVVPRPRPIQGMIHAPNPPALSARIRFNSLLRRHRRLRRRRFIFGSGHWQVGINRQHDGPATLKLLRSCRMERYWLPAAFGQPIHRPEIPLLVEQ
jgi:hypothetical protein